MVALIGMVNWFTFVESATVAQFVPRPAAMEFVCDCKRQPVWSDGQLNCNWPPLITTAHCGGVVDTSRADTGSEFVLSPAAFTAETT